MEFTTPGRPGSRAHEMPMILFGSVSGVLESKVGILHDAQTEERHELEFLGSFELKLENNWDWQCEKYRLRDNFVYHGGLQYTQIINTLSCLVRLKIPDRVNRHTLKCCHPNKWYSEEYSEDGKTKYGTLKPSIREQPKIET